MGTYLYMYVPPIRLLVCLAYLTSKDIPHQRLPLVWNNILILSARAFVKVLDAASDIRVPVS